MAYEFLAVSEPVNAVARLTLKRESKRNALCMAMRDELEDAFAALVTNAGVNAVVLAGGDGIFCAGFDLKEGLESGGEAFFHRFREFFSACYLFPKPVVAAVDGPALAGGFDLALTADFIIASPRATFGHPEIDFGPVAVLPLARFVSPSRLREMVMLGETLDAAAAKAAGIVYQIVEAGETEAVATALAERLAAKPPAAIGATKRALMHGLEEWIAADTEALAAIRQGVDDVYASYVKRRLG